MSARPDTAVVMPTIRAMSFGSLVVGVTVASALVALSETPLVPNPYIYLSLGLVLTASVAGYALDDSATVTLQSSPTALRHRRALRLCIAGFVLAVGVSFDLMVVTVAGDGDAITHRLGALLAVAAVSLAASDVAGRHAADHQGGAVGATTAVVIAFVLEVLSSRWPRLFPSAALDRDANERWWWVFLIAAAVVAWYSRDPARSR